MLVTQLSQSSNRCMSGIEQVAGFDLDYLRYVHVKKEVIRVIRALCMQPFNDQTIICHCNS